MLSVPQLGLSLPDNRIRLVGNLNEKSTHAAVHRWDSHFLADLKQVSYPRGLQFPHP